MKKILYTFIGALIVSSILLGLRTSALANAYDSTNAFNVTDSAGTVHTVEASGISGDTVALLYALGAGLVWLVAVIYIIFAVVNQLKAGR